jgi:hypothetical protein
MISVPLAGTAPVQASAIPTKNKTTNKRHDFVPY